MRAFFSALIRNFSSRSDWDGIAIAAQLFQPRADKSPLRECNLSGDACRDGERKGAGTEAREGVMEPEGGTDRL